MFKNRALYLIVRRSRYKLTQRLYFSVYIKVLPTVIAKQTKQQTENVFFLIAKLFHFIPAVMMKKKTLVCQFASPLDVDVHSKPEVSHKIV